MTILTKFARKEVLTKVLKEAFEPKFAELRDWLKVCALDWRRTHHPIFEELLACKDARGYLHTKNFWGSYIKGRCMYYPDYPTEFSGHKIKINEVTVPYICEDDFLVNNNDLSTAYSKLWVDYTSARSELFKILSSYKTHEALINDFPEYVGYLPTPVIKQLPSVIPSESRAKLTALGIPAK